MSAFEQQIADLKVALNTNQANNATINSKISQMQKHLILKLIITTVIFSFSNFSFVLGEIPDADTAILRFSQNFFNVFSLLPLSIIVLSGFIIFYGVREKKTQDSKIAKKLILIGSIIIFLGIAMFGTYLID